MRWGFRKSTLTFDVVLSQTATVLSGDAPLCICRMCVCVYIYMDKSVHLTTGAAGTVVNWRHHFLQIQTAVIHRIQTYQKAADNFSIGLNT